MAGNKNLRAADKAKNDEFYTQLPDIENELNHYREHFAGKTVLCNCDDPYESNFFKYFTLNFNILGLKKLIATCYDGSPVAGNELQLNLFGNDDVETPYYDVSTVKRTAHKIIITEVTDLNGDGAIDMFDVELLLKNGKNVLTKLQGSGDFRSAECVELLKEADIVVTNPPFSLFREYVAQLISHEKEFLIIGNQNAISYKEIFPLIEQNKLWLGCSNPKEFFTTKIINKNCYKNSEGEIFAKFGNICWFTNLDHKKRHEELILFKRYSPEEYPKYDNYDAINVNKTTDIPMDYAGTMGVPITFLDKYNPEQFEIIDGIGRYSILDNEATKKAKKYLSMINGNAIYFRIIIRRRQPKEYEQTAESISLAAEE